MTPGRFRGATLVGVVLLAIGAMQLTPPRNRKPAELLFAPVHVPTDRIDTDTIKWGETLAGLLARRGLRGADAVRALSVNPMDARRIRAGMQVSVRSQMLDSIPEEIILHASPEVNYRLRRTVDGWEAHEERIPWAVDTIVARGEVQTNLVHAFQTSEALPGDARAELAYEVADIYEYRVDMSRDLRVGDSVVAVFERYTHPIAGVRIGQVIGATLTLSGQHTEAIRFDRHGYEEYFDQDGKSLRASFLRAPLAFRRISSVFGMRRHPILGTFRRHQGTDYSAATGTPVRTVGNGVVIFAGRKGGYGNCIEVRHPNGFVTRYGHLNGFSSAGRRGSRVSIGQTIGYVGSTGLSTAPHLHFEVLVNGVQRDPRHALKQKGGAPVPAAHRLAFDSARSRVLSMYSQLPDVVALSAQ